MLLLIAIGIVGGGLYYQKQTSNVAGQLQGYDTILSQYTAAKQQNQSLTAQLSSKQTEINGKLLSKDQFIQFLGNTSKHDNLKLVGFKTGNSSTIAGMNDINFVFELEGSVPNISSFIQNMQNLNLGYRLNSISFRQNDTVLWNQRDTSNMNALGWATFGNTETSGGQASSGTTGQTEPILNKSTLMSGNDFYLYIDLDFITNSN